MPFPQTIGWLTRERWAGRLLLDLNQPRQKISYLSLITTLFFLYMCFAPVAAKMRSIALVQVVWGGGSWLIIAGRLEIREKGIVRKGKLIRWGNIESYEWTSQVAGWGKPSPVVLKVHVRRLLKALPPARIPIPAERREEVDAVLSRYLSDWPMAASGDILD